MQSSHKLEHIATLASVLASIFGPKCSVRFKRVYRLSHVLALRLSEALWACRSVGGHFPHANNATRYMEGLPSSLPVGWMRGHGEIISPHQQVERAVNPVG